MMRNEIKRRRAYVTLIAIACMALFTGQGSFAKLKPPKSSEEFKGLSAHEKSVLDSNDTPKIRELLDSLWEPFAMNPQLRTADYRQKLRQLFDLATYHDNREIRTLGFKRLASLREKEYFPRALREFREAVFEGDSTSEQELTSVIGLFLRTTDVRCDQEVQRASKYQNLMVSILVEENKVDQLPSNILSEIVAENIESDQPREYRISQSGLLALAERNAHNVRSLIKTGQSSSLRVSVKGKHQFYPIRHSAQIAERILDVSSASDKESAVIKLLNSTDPQGSDEGHVLFLWCLDYIRKNNMKATLPDLENRRADPKLGTFFKDRIGQVVSTLKANEKE